MNKFRENKATWKKSINITVITFMLSILICQDAQTQMAFYVPYIPHIPKSRPLTPEERAERQRRIEARRRLIAKEYRLTREIRNILREDIYMNLNPIIQNHYEGQFDLEGPFSFHTPTAIYVIYGTTILGGFIVALLPVGIIAAGFTISNAVAGPLAVGGMFSMFMSGIYGFTRQVVDFNEWGYDGYLDTDNRKRFVYSLVDNNDNVFEKECIIHLKYSGTRRGFRITWELDWCPDLPQDVSGELRISETSRLFDIGQETVVTKGSIDFPYPKPRLLHVFRH